MATHRVRQPDGYTYHFKRSDKDKMQFDPSGMSPEQVELLAKIETAQPAIKATDGDDGTTKVVSVVPVRGRLAQVLGFLGLDGWRN